MRNGGHVTSDLPSTACLGGDPGRGEGDGQHRVRASRSCGRSEQLGQPDQIIGGRREGERPVDLLEAAELGSSQACDGLDPAERLLDPLADAQAGCVAGVASGAAIDRRTSAADVLGDVRSDVQW